MPIEIMKRYTRQDIANEPNKLFIFGDNFARVGMGGQAGEARGEPNALGIRTKKAPTYNESDFLTDKEYAWNVRNIFYDFGKVLVALEAGQVVVWPEDGIGTGLANLRTTAPLTLKFIEDLIGSLKQVYGVDNAA